MTARRQITELPVEGETPMKLADTDPTVPPTGITNTEPLALKTAVERLAQAVIAGLIVFDVWHPTADQMAWVVATMALVGALLDSLVRLKVWSPASHAKAVAAAEAKVPAETATQLAAAEAKAALADQMVSRRVSPPQPTQRASGPPPWTYPPPVPNDPPPTSS